MIDKKLIGMLGKDKKYLFIIAILNLVGMLANVSITALVCALIGLAVAGSKVIVDYVIYASIIICLVMLKFIITLLTSKFRERLGCIVRTSLRDKIADKIFEQGVTGSDEQRSSLTQLTIEGVEQLDLYFTQYLPQFIFAMISPLILFIICVVLEWTTALVLILCLPLIPISIIIVSKYAKKVFAKYWGIYTNLGDSFLDNIQGMKELKIFNADDDKSDTIAKNAESFRKVTMKVLVMQLCSLTIMDIVAFGGAGIAIVMALIHGIQSGEAMITLFLILISAEFFLPMRALGSAFHIAMNGATAGNKILEYLDTPTSTWSDGSVEKIDSITLEDLTFAYNNDNYVINNASLTCRTGLNSIVGESGCGKSTIVSLVIGAYEAQLGRVLINDTQLQLLDRDKYYSRIGLVSYNTFIFNASIRDNFKFASERISDDDINTALSKVNMLEFVEEVGGLDYVILEDSENISGGQRQRLAIAINLVADKDVYIFDEATSNIDIESEQVIMNNIKELSTGKIVIMISHRLQNVVNSDVIYFLEKGNITEHGNHSSLMDINGSYCAIYSKQKQLEEGYKEASNA